LRNAREKERERRKPPPYPSGGDQWGFPSGRRGMGGESGGTSFRKSGKGEENLFKFARGGKKRKKSLGEIGRSENFGKGGGGKKKSAFFNHLGGKIGKRGGGGRVPRPLMKKKTGKGERRTRGPFQFSGEGRFRRNGKKGGEGLYLLAAKKRGGVKDL